MKKGTENHLSGFLFPPRESVISSDTVDIEVSRGQENMASQLLVRNVPKHIRSWIETERVSSGLTQQEVLLGCLEKAYEYRNAERFPLFTSGQSGTAERPAPQAVPFKFVDLFAGIGGFRIALEKLGGKCVFTCEWDRYAQKTYKAWHGELPHGDIRKVSPSDIPDHDLMAAGFPCQPFSIAGVSKKKSLGRAHGFKCASQGNLFFYLASIVEVKRPPVLFLENVKNLVSHDKGQTWRVIKGTLEELEYEVFHSIIDARQWVPQHRERIYIVCFDKKVFGPDVKFQFPTSPNSSARGVESILESECDAKYTLSEHLWTYLRKYAEKHRAKGNGFGFGLVNPKDVTRTLSARYYKDGSEILIPQNGRPPRRLTPTECAKLMGFDPGRYPIVVSDTQAYRQFGNAVCPLVVEAVGHEIIKQFARHLRKSGNGCLLKARERITEEAILPRSA